jgi:hypothetical protein
MSNTEGQTLFENLVSIFQRCSGQKLLGYDDAVICWEHVFSFFMQITDYLVIKVIIEIISKVVFIVLEEINPIFKIR